MVLGQTWPGKRPAVNTILGLQDSEQGTDVDDTQECSKHRGEVAGRQVREWNTQQQQENKPAVVAIQGQRGRSNKDMYQMH